MQNTGKWQTHVLYSSNSNFTSAKFIINGIPGYQCLAKYSQWTPSRGNRDAHALSPVGHFLWDTGPINVTIRRQKK